jgi:oligopeptide transport system substrate-binding protein
MRFVLPFLLILALLLAVASYDKGAPRADFVIAQPVDTFTLDPQRMSWQQDIRTAGALYEPLVRKDPFDRSDDPGVAESWQVDDARTGWTFHLRKDARWSNGDPVTAQDFVFAFRRAMLPDSASDYAGFFFEIAGAEEFFQWRSRALEEYAKAAARGEGGTPEAAEKLWKETLGAFDRMVQLTAVDDKTLAMTLRRPVPYWLSLVGFPVMSPIHVATYQAHSWLDPRSGRVMDDPGWTKAGTSVTNGPFQLAQWRYKRVLRLERNPYYWDAALVGVDSIDILPINDNNTAVLAFNAGSVDWVTDLRVGYRVEMAQEALAYVDRHRAQYQSLLDQGKSVDEALALLPPPGPGERRDVQVLPTFGTDFYSFNCLPTLVDGSFNPFKDKRVRRAFAMAVDKQALSDRVIRTGERVAGSLVPPGSVPGYTPPVGLPYDPARARAEMEAAGWKDRNNDGIVEDETGRPFPTIDLLYSTNSERYRDLTIALSDMWRRRLGVNVELRGKSSEVFKDDLKNGHYMIARGGWYGDFEDPTTFLDISKTGDGNNDRKFSNAQFDQLLDRAGIETDPQARFQLLHDAERMLVEDELPILPLSHFSTLYMYDPTRVRGLTRNQRLEQKLARIRMVQPAP